MEKKLAKNMSLRDISRREKKYICLVIVAILAFNFLFLPLIVNAQSTNSDNSWGAVGEFIGWIAGKPLLFASDTISLGIATLFGVIISTEAKIIDYIVNPNNFSLINTPIVTLGWGITRDLANMFFILILLIIAFTTVLRIKSWNIQQLWWKVVVAALLINFSLVIAGFVLNFAQVLTDFFLKGISGGGFITLTTKIASAMKITNFYKPALTGGASSGTAQFDAAAFAALIGIILTLIGSVVTAFVFGAAMIFLIVRIFWIWLLLIFAPIVWMLWILPPTSGYFSQWWRNFLRWAFFAPIFVFMIWLSLSIFDANGNLNPSVFGPFPNYLSTPPPGLTQVGLGSAILQWILVIGLMFSSLIVAQKSGVAGANASVKMLTKWKDNSKNWAVGQAITRALSVGAKEGAPGKEARPGILVQGAQKLAAVPGGRLLADQIFKMTAAEAKTIEAAQKQFANWTPEAIQAYLQKSPGRITNALSQNQQVGAALALKEKGKLEKLEEPRIRELISMASRYSPRNVDKLLEVAPELAPEFNKKIEAIVPKIEKAEQIRAISLRNSKVVLNLDPNKLRDIVQKGGPNKVQIVKNVVEASFGTLPASVQTEINTILSDPNKGKRNQKLNAFLERQTAAGVSIEGVRRYEKIARAKAISSAPAWQI